MNLSHTDKKYWDFCIFQEKDSPRLIEAARAKDGLLYKFNLEDIKEILGKYPASTGGCRKWYFNESKDREIAEEVRSGIVNVNPQFVMNELGDLLY